MRKREAEYFAAIKARDLREVAVLLKEDKYLVTCVDRVINEGAFSTCIDT